MKSRDTYFARVGKHAHKQGRGGLPSHAVGSCNFQDKTNSLEAAAGELITMFSNGDRLVLTDYNSDNQAERSETFQCSMNTRKARGNTCCANFRVSTASAQVSVQLSKVTKGEFGPTAKSAGSLT